MIISRGTHTHLITGFTNYVVFWFHQLNGTSGILHTEASEYQLFFLSTHYDSLLSDEFLHTIYKFMYILKPSALLVSVLHI